MASFELQVKHSNGSTSKLSLWDTFGPLNKWEFSDKNAFVPANGDFTNQTNNVVPTIPNFWILKNIDIDKAVIGTNGNGEVISNSGSFPEGQITWTVLRQLY